MLQLPLLEAMVPPDCVSQARNPVPHESTPTGVRRSPCVHSYPVSRKPSPAGVAAELRSTDTGTRRGRQRVGLESAPGPGSPTLSLGQPSWPAGQTRVESE